MTTSLHETSDIYLACFLLSQGATFDHCERVGPRRNNFYFVADDKLHRLLRQYWMHEPLKLVPAQLFAALRQLKSLSRLRSTMGRGGRVFLDTALPAAEDSTADKPFPSEPC